jgi:hypothetical protein
VQNRVWDHQREIGEAEHDGAARTTEKPLGGPLDLLARLQRSIGNRAVGVLWGVGQAKLAVGASDDPLEREADDIARSVVSLLEAGGPARQEGDAGDPDHFESGADRSGEQVAEQVAGRVVDRAVDRHFAGRPPALVRRLSEVGAEGGKVSAKTEADIEHARRSGGVPMDRSTRTAMEQAFGTDFGEVRLHAGRAASNLNARVQAKAFTVGNDVFFRDAVPDSRSRQGRELLAHELAHTVQQGGARAVGRKIQRLELHNTDWSKAKSAKVSEGGGLGVLIIKDSKGPLIVKAGEKTPSEAAVAAQLLSESTQGGAGKMKASAPEARLVGRDEAAQIYAVANKLLGHGDPTREKNVLSALQDGEGIIVFGFAPGVEVSKLLKETQTTKKGEITKKSVSYAFMHDPDLLQTLGRGAAADVTIGNFDRLIGMTNLENMMLDMKRKKLSFIDNIQMREEAFLRDAPEFKVKGRTAFTVWASNVHVQRFTSRDFTGMAQEALAGMNGLIEAITGDIRRQVPKTEKGAKRSGAVTREAEAKAVKANLEESLPQMTKWFIQGLTEGLQSCIAGLAPANVKKIVGSLDPALRRHAATNLLARRGVLLGLTPDSAWLVAEQQAASVFSSRPRAVQSSSSSSRDDKGTAASTQNRPRAYAVSGKVQ